MSAEAQQKQTAIPATAEEAESRPLRPTSPRKVAANRRNAKRSTGPKTPEGKAQSSRNAIKHGIFVKQLLKGAEPDTIASIEALANDLRDYYKPVGALEEMLVETIVVESTRYGRALRFETPEPGDMRGMILHCLDFAARYTTSTSRALFRAIDELERLQAARRTREDDGAPVVSDSVHRETVNDGSNADESQSDGGATDGFESASESVGEQEAP